MINAARKIMIGAVAYKALQNSGIGANSTGTQTDSCNDVAVDDEGNYFIVGQSQPSATLPGYLVKFPPSLLPYPSWQRKQSLAARFYLTSVGVDSSGSAYAAGQGYVSSSPELPHLSKYNSAGSIQWQRKLTTSDTATVRGLVITSAGDSYLMINVSGASPQYFVVAKYNSAGSIQWQRKVSSTYRVWGNGIAPTSDGGVVVCGYFYDGGNSSTYNRGIVVKYDSSGTIQWQYKIHFSVSGVYNSIAVDSVTGDIYLGGYAAVSGQKGVLVKLNSSGVVQWHKIHPTVATGVVALTVDPASGNVYEFQQQVNDITGFDSDGDVIWARDLVAESAIAVRKLAINGDSLLVCAQAQKTDNGYDLTMLSLPKDTGGTVGTYGHVTTSDPGSITYTTGSITSASAGLTDAAGALSDAAGIAVDAESDLTFYSL